MQKQEAQCGITTDSKLDSVLKETATDWVSVKPSSPSPAPYTHASCSVSQAHAMLHEALSACETQKEAPHKTT